MFIDAFSNDGTYEKLQRYAKEGKIILKQLKGFPPVAYNYAFKSIKSELTAITNADCVAERNWLKEIVKPFEKKDVVAVTGLVKNPKKTTSKLQEIVGRELEDRYKHFSKEITRAPEMNMCIRTTTAREIMFDEKLEVSYDADFGYRLTKEFNKIIYQKSAVIIHYHRASWTGFFKQQLKYAKTVPKVYFKKHITKIFGDEISKPSMMLQVLLIYLGLLFSALTFFGLPGYLPITVFLLLFLTYFVDIVRLSRSIEDAAWFLALFVVRNVAWTIGIAIGTAKLL
jgi:GT2 family glycosyltransferase